MLLSVSPSACPPTVFFHEHVSILSTTRFASLPIDWSMNGQCRTLHLLVLVLALSP